MVEFIEEIERAKRVREEKLLRCLDKFVNVRVGGEVKRALLLQVFSDRCAVLFPGQQKVMFVKPSQVEVIDA